MKLRPSRKEDRAPGMIKWSGMRRVFTLGLTLLLGSAAGAVEPPPATPAPAAPAPAAPAPAAPAPKAAPATTPVTPEQFEAARKEYDEGAHAYEQGEYESALRHFQTAFHLAPSPVFWFNIGRCHERL